MAEDEKPLAQQWFEEQQAWQKTMRDYADATVKDQQFLMHMGNAMRGSLLAGTSYPVPGNPADEHAPDVVTAEILFTLKKLEGRLRDIEATLELLTESAGLPGAAASGERSK